MSIKEMDMRAATYFDLLEQIETLQAEAEAIKDSFKAAMIDQASEELEGHMAQRDQQPPGQPEAESRYARPVQGVQ